MSKAAATTDKDEATDESEDEGKVSIKSINDYDHLVWLKNPSDLTCNPGVPTSLNSSLQVACFGKNSGSPNQNYAGQISITLNDNPNQYVNIANPTAPSKTSITVYAANGVATFAGPQLVVLSTQPPGSYPVDFIAFATNNDVNRVYSEPSSVFNVIVT